VRHTVPNVCLRYAIFECTSPFFDSSHLTNDRVQTKDRALGFPAVDLFQATSHRVHAPLEPESVPAAPPLRDIRIPGVINDPPAWRPTGLPHVPYRGLDPATAVC
jgi:hypothetical protein